MAELEIRVDAKGLELAEKQLSPQRVYEIFTRWFMEGPELVRAEMRRRAKPIVRSRVKIKKDPYRPPRWALIGSTHPLAHIFEGGTGRQGAAGFNHADRHFPAVNGRWGLMEVTGLPKARAFAMAASISEQGGLKPQPFVAPTEQAVRGPLLSLWRRIVDEVAK